MRPFFPRLNTKRNGQKTRGPHPKVPIAFCNPCLLLRFHGESSTSTAPGSSAAVFDSTLALWACRRRFPSVTHGTAGFTGLPLVSGMSENGCGKCGVCASRGPGDRRGCRTTLNHGCGFLDPENNNQLPGLDPLLAFVFRLTRKKGSQIQNVRKKKKEDTTHLNTLKNTER